MANWSRTARLTVSASSTDVLSLKEWKDIADKYKRVGRRSASKALNAKAADRGELTAPAFQRGYCT